MNKKNILLVLGLASALLVTGCPAATDTTALETAKTNAENKLGEVQKELNTTKKELEAAKAATDPEAIAKAAAEKAAADKAAADAAAGVVADADIIAKGPWTFTYQQMCQIADKARTNPSADLENAVKVIKANRVTVEKIAGYTKGAQAITSVPAEAAKIEEGKLKEIYDAQSKSGWSSGDDIVKDKGITYRQVEEAFYKEILKRFSGIAKDGYGIKAMVAYDLCWYFSNIILPPLIKNDKLDAVEVNKFAVTAITDDGLPTLALIIKQLASSGDTLYSQADVAGPAAPIFDKDGKLSSTWDVNKTGDNQAGIYAYLEAKAIAYLGSTDATKTTKFNDISVEILKDAKFGDFKTEAAKFTATEASKDYTLTGATEATKSLLSRYFDLLDLLALGQNAADPAPTKYTAAPSITIDDVLTLKHASQTPRMRLAAYTALKPETDGKWKAENQVLLFPADGYTAKDSLKRYFGRRKTDINTVAATKDLLFTHETKDATL